MWVFALASNNEHELRGNTLITSLTEKELYKERTPIFLRQKCKDKERKQEKL